jgi:hypothetical protein
MMLDLHVQASRVEVDSVVIYRYILRCDDLVNIEILVACLCHLRC